MKGQWGISEQRLRNKWNRCQWWHSSGDCGMWTASGVIGCQTMPVVTCKWQLIAGEQASDATCITVDPLLIEQIPGWYTIVEVNTIKWDLETY